MDINPKMLQQLASQVGMDKSNPNASQKAQNMAQQYQNKSEDEILQEIMKLKSSMKQNRGQYEKQIKAIRSLRGMMNQEQKARLDKVLRMLDD